MGEVGVRGEARVLGGVEGLGVLVRVGQVRREGRRVGLRRLEVRLRLRGDDGLVRRGRRGQVERTQVHRVRRGGVLVEERVQGGRRRGARQRARGEDGRSVREVGLRLQEGGVRVGKHLGEVGRGRGEVLRRVLLHVHPLPRAVVRVTAGEIHGRPGVRVQPVSPRLVHRPTPQVGNRVSPRVTVMVTPRVTGWVSPRVGQRMAARIAEMVSPKVACWVRPRV